MTTSNLIAKVQALIARAIRSPFAEEARTSAMVAIQLIHEHDLLGDLVVIREVERVVAPITDSEIDEIIREHQRERARKGGVARARKLTSDELSDAATHAARSRWRQWRQRRRAGKTA
jgi:hypothetical protein